MAPKSKENELHQELIEYLHIVREFDPETHPINVKSVAAAIGISRTTIYKYDWVEEIHQAHEYQLQMVRSNPTAALRYRDKLKIQALATEIECWKQRCLAQAVELAIIDENAQRHGIDPESLRTSPPKSDRSMNHTNRRNQRKTR